MKAEFDFSQFTTPWDQEIAMANYPEDQYHATVAMSSGRLKLLMQSPAHFAASIAGEKAKDTPALRFGRIAHKAILEGAEFRADYQVIPIFKGKGSKRAREQWFEENEDAIFITSEEEGHLAGMCESVLDHPVARALIQGCEKRTEISGFFNFEDIRSRLRADVWRTDDIIVDLKTCQNAEEMAFMRDAWKLRYPIQAAWYLNGATKIAKRPMRTFVFIAVEKTPPYAVMVYSASEAFLSAGDRMIQIAIKRFREAIRTGRWIGYSEKAQDLQPPHWGIRDMEEMERVEALYSYGNSGSL